MNKKLEQKIFKGDDVMNIQEAVKESLRTKKMIARKSSATGCVFMATNTYDLVVIWTGNKNRLPSRGWQPTADDLIANDWYLTDVDFVKA